MRISYCILFAKYPNFTENNQVQNDASIANPDIFGLFGANYFIPAVQQELCDKHMLLC